MAVRKDEVNLQITIGAEQAGSTLRELKKEATTIRRALERIPVGTKEFDEAAAKLKKVNAQISEATAKTKGLTQQTSLWQRALSVAGGIGIFSLIQNGLNSLFNFGKTSLTLIDEQLKADAQIKQAIESTGGIAGKSLEELQQQASDLQKVTLFGDDQTEQAQALLLTFTNIRGEIFDKTIPIIQDLSTAFDQDLKASSIQLGKALNDPANGFTALQRIGITFSAEQKNLIKTLQATGDVAGAQTVILKELERQVGGSARAAAEAGLGPYQVLQNRLVEVQESFGLLIERGLKIVAPLLKGVVVFVEGFTKALLTGEEATGEFSTAINITIGVLTGLVKVGQTAFSVFKGLYEVVLVPIGNFFLKTIIPAIGSAASQLAAFIERGKSLPIIGTIFKAITASVKVFKDLFESVPATFAGFRAAANQAVENVKEYFVGLIRSAKIVAKELELALTIRTDARSALQAEINELKRQETAAKAAGKTVGEAYASARNAALTEINATNVAAEKKEADAQAITKKREAEALAAQLKKEAAEQAKTAAAAAEENRKKALELSLKQMEAGFLIEELVADKALSDRTISENHHAKTILDLKRQLYEDQLAAFKRFHQEESKEAIEAQRKLFEITQQRTQQGVAPVTPLATRAPGQVTSQTAGIAGADVSAADDEQVLREKFARIVTLEQANELARIDIQRNALNARLEFLRNAGLQESALFQETLGAKLKADEDYQAAIVENEKRTAELKKKVQEASFQVASDFFQLAVDLLGKDEKARKKNGAAIKAFNAANVFVQGLAEVQKIWAHAADLGPIAGPIIGALQTGFAIGRTILAIGKINATKFARGTMMQFAKWGFFGGKPHSAGGTKGYFDDGTAIEVERDEAFAVVNKKNAPLLRALSAINSLDGNGVPFFANGGLPKFATGGLPTVSTTPTGVASPQAAAQPLLSNMHGFIEAVDEFGKIVRLFPREVKSRVVYTELRDTASEVATVEADASI